MSETERDRIVRLEKTLELYQESLQTIVDLKEAIIRLKYQSEDLNSFKDGFEESVNKQIHRALTSTTYDAELTAKMTEIVHAILHNEKSNNELTAKIDKRIETHDKARLAKIALWFGGIIPLIVSTGVVTFARQIFGE